MIKKTLILSSVLLLVGAESAYFGRACAAGLFRIGAERAFFRNEHQVAWRLYNRALAWGGNRETLEVDLVELLLFGLDQRDAGVTLDLPLPAEDAIRAAREMIARRLRETPYRAYCWSLASDLSMHEAYRYRRVVPLDLTTFSEDPLVNLLPEQRRALADLEIASRLEPLNYVYQDLLKDLFQDLSVPELADEACRRAVRDFPHLDDHRYLLAPDLSHTMLEAAVAGFEDALRDDSLVPRQSILLETGRLLAHHGDDARAEPYLAKVLDINPDHYDALMEVAMIRLRRRDDSRALDALTRAGSLRPEDPWPDYYSGVAEMELGRTDRAVTAFQSAREKDPGDLKIFQALGSAYEARGQMKEAERQFSAAANLNPQVAEAWSLLLDFHLRHRNARGAQEACSQLSRLNGGKGPVKDACHALEQGLP